jgi:hypothetical protein
MRVYAQNALTDVEADSPRISAYAVVFRLYKKVLYGLLHISPNPSIHTQSKSTTQAPYCNDVALYRI